jgi:beta-mannosidase
VAWVNNQFRRYTYDVSDYLSSSTGEDNNLTIALESAWYYGLNVTMRPDAEYFPNTPIVSTSNNVCTWFVSKRTSDV